MPYQNHAYRQGIARPGRGRRLQYEYRGSAPQRLFQNQQDDFS